MCYAQQVADSIDAAYIVIDGVPQWKYHTLRWGDYPQLLVSSIQIPATFAGSTCDIVIGGAPYDTQGKFRMGAVRVLISSIFLFSLGLSFQADLDSQNVSADLQNAFEQNSGILLAPNVILLVQVQGSRWLLADELHKRAYSITKDGNKLNVYTSVPDNAAIGEYIRTTGSPLTRGNGAGIGLPVSLVGLSGYLPPAPGRPQLPLLNSTQIIGLASGSGPSGERPTLQKGEDVGYQYFDTELNHGKGLPIWWSGTQWIKADGTTA
jgi:hypothetical protein